MRGKGQEVKDDSGAVQRSCLWGNCGNGGTRDMASHTDLNTWSCFSCWLSSLFSAELMVLGAVLFKLLIIFLEAWETLGYGSFRMGLQNSQDLLPQSRYSSWYEMSAHHMLLENCGEWLKTHKVFSTQDSAPTFDPLLGFPNGRVPRVLNATQVSQFYETLNQILNQEEMEAVQLSPGHKNHCADLSIKAKVGY